MATTMVSSYFPGMYFPQMAPVAQPYAYPMAINPFYNNTVQPFQTVPSVESTTVQYKDFGDLPPRRKPRVYRQVIVLPTPEPIFRQVRHRLPTPEREVIQRTIIQSANGEKIIEQRRPGKRPARAQSRSEQPTQQRTPRSRQVHTD